MQNQIISVPFYEDMLAMIGKDNEPMVAMRPIVENMGLDWKTQHEKLNERFKSVVGQMPATGSDGKTYEMTCLPLRKLPAWLYSIYPNKVAPELKEKIIRYQNECDDVLWDHWTQGGTKSGVVQIQMLAPREPAPQAVGNSSIRLKMRDILTMQQQCRDRMREIEKTESPAIRAGLFEQLRFIADQIGHDVPDLDHFAFPKPAPLPLPVEPVKLAPAPRPRQPVSVNQFWDIVRQLEESGIALNHSRLAHRIAINLPEVAELAEQHKLRMPDMAVLRKSIKDSKDPAFIEATDVSSILRKKPVKCHVFDAQGYSLKN
ncbi:MAG: phage antirepressor N-terminal domain-containing protein [Undibacterium umbellatum]|uniref:phage antirepressor N-terminal domain-containing protein n=1 Tax=Undibacterium umbellatum TaxID=2762300 RepID=UPI003BB65D9B